MEDPIAALFVASSVERLHKLTVNIEACLSRLSDDQIWSRGGSNENAVGNLILHLCGNARQWIVSGIGGSADVRERDDEFSAQGDWTREQLQNHLRKSVDEAVEVMEAVTPARLTEIVTPQGYSLTVLEAIYQVTGHYHQHTGQIIFATKLLTGEELGLFTRLARADSRNPF